MIFTASIAKGSVGAEMEASARTSMARVLSVLMDGVVSSVANSAKRVSMVIGADSRVLVITEPRATT